MRSPAARDATESRERLFDEVLVGREDVDTGSREEDEPDELLSDCAVRSPADRDVTVSREPELLVVLVAGRLDGALFVVDELDELEELEELVLAGERSARLPDPVSMAIRRSYVVTVTVPSATVAVSGPAHISSSLTTVSTPALEKTMPGTSP